MNFKTWEVHFLSGLNADLLDFGFAGSIAIKNFFKNLFEKTRIVNIKWLVNDGETPEKEEILSAIQREANLSQRENVLSVVESRSNINFNFCAEIQIDMDGDVAHVNDFQEDMMVYLNATGEYLNIDWQKVGKVCRSAIIRFIFRGQEYEFLIRTFKSSGNYRESLITGAEIEGVRYGGIVHSINDENLVLASDSLANLILKPLENNSIKDLIFEIGLQSNLIFNNDLEIASCLNKTFNYLVSKDNITNDEIKFLLKQNKNIQSFVDRFDVLNANYEYFKINMIQILESEEVTLNGKIVLDAVLERFEPEDLTGECLNVFRKYSINNFELKKEVDGTEIVVTWNGTELTSNVEKCPRCNGFSPKLFVDPDGHRMCFSCLKRNYNSISSRVLSYHGGSHSNVQPSLGEMPSEKSRYGFELEMIRNNNSYEWLNEWQEKVMPIMMADGNVAKLNRDGSLNEGGEEMISQPLNKDYILGEKIKTLIDECAKLYHPDDSCGLHVHVDKSALTPEQWGKVLIIIFHQYEELERAEIFRPTNDYNTLYYIEKIIDEVGEEDPEKIYQKLVEYCGHYSTVNVDTSTRKTIEFRMFDSTVDYNRFIKNIKFLMLLMDNVDLLYDVTKNSTQLNFCVNA